ncbi:DEAD/DEAH box helicase [Hymenobacter properus]|uniref:DEAD/DEAH box helicase family protein n=1 Tax=Hymenobacter properus TaxID=2791026 RepID=A0A931BII8_9BACT|nr:DEAD/DEAH box helicase [Hymenobacter properus]MBF9140823.1 DEAD/DEAH box helicase family protein [Hymenobacter properus]MBR7719632.1 DEAD/DEAH box helicase family protein [Microvirga sp. SRT04]
MANLPTLRDYQTTAITDCARALVAHPSVVLVLPTGAGKTTVAAEMARRMVGKGKRVWFVAHLFELVSQARARMELFGLTVGCIAAGWEYHPARPVQCCMVQTLSKRIAKLPAHQLPDFIFFDEGHHTAAGTYQRVIEAVPNAKRIGLTATPFRLDGKGLREWYADLVAPITAAELVARGYLVPARYYATEADLEGIAKRGGDYAADELYKKFNKRELYAGTVINYLNFAEGRKAIVFCVNVEHSLQTTQAFLDEGIACAHLDGSTPAAQRAKVLAEFAAGRWQVLCNVALFTEGFDLPDLGCVILNRATQSKSLYLQMVGRGLRPAAGKQHCVVIDHGGNVKAHGFFDDEVEHSLDAPEKKRKNAALDVAPIKFCPGCQLINKVQARVCEECGHEFPAAVKEAKEAEFVEIQRKTTVIGGLTVSVVVDKKKALPAELEGVPMSAMSREQLRQVARFRGYHPRWVDRQMEVRTKYAEKGGVAA